MRATRVRMSFTQVVVRRSMSNKGMIPSSRKGREMLKNLPDVLFNFLLQEPATHFLLSKDLRVHFFFCKVVEIIHLYCVTLQF